MQERIDIVNCPSCGYAAPKFGSCCNPVCFANPSMTDDTRKMLMERMERNRAEAAERERINRIRASCFSKLGN